MLFKLACCMLSILELYILLHSYSIDKYKVNLDGSNHLFKLSKILVGVTLGLARRDAAFDVL